MDEHARRCLFREGASTFRNFHDGIKNYLNRHDVIGDLIDRLSGLKEEMLDRHISAEASADAWANKKFTPADGSTGAAGAAGKQFVAAEMQQEVSSLQRSISNQRDMQIDARSALNSWDFSLSSDAMLVGYYTGSSMQSALGPGENYRQIDARSAFNSGDCSLSSDAMLDRHDTGSSMQSALGTGEHLNNIFEPRVGDDEPRGVDDGYEEMLSLDSTAPSGE